LESSNNRLENIKTLRASHVDVGFAAAFGTLIGGSFLVGYIKTITSGGEADRWIGLLTAFPSLLGLIQIPGAIWGRSFPSYRKFILPGGLIWRLCHVPIAFLPLIAISTSAKLPIMLLCVTIAAAVINIVNPIYNDWLAEIVPSNSRGSFFATRNTIMTAVGASIGVAGGFGIDYFKHIDKTSVGYSVVFGSAIVCAAISMFFFTKMQDIPRENPIKQDFGDSLKAFAIPFRDMEFRKVLIFLFVFISGQSFAGLLWSAFAFETLNFSQTNLQMCAMTHAIGNIVASRWWGYLADKYGNKPILTMVGVLMLATPLPWLACRPDSPTYNMIVLVVCHVWMGMAWSGIMVCQFNLLLATSKPADRPTYIGTGLAVQSLAGAMAPYLGAELLAQARGWVPTSFGAYHIVFWVTIGIRFVGLLLLGRIREEGSTNVKATFKVLTGVTPRGLKAMRSFSRSGDAVERQTAIGEMAEKNFTLGVEEMIKALHDPSPRVRRQAAAGLGRLGDPAAVAELVHQLQFHPDLVEEETIEALGDLGDEAAIPELIKLLSSPRPLIRRAAARAISSIPGAQESKAAIDALINAAESTQDPDLRRASLQALRNLEAPGIAATVSHALVDKHPSVRIAAAEAAGEMELKDVAEACRAALVLYDDEANAEVAYALGVVGTTDDIPRILAVAQTCESVTTRRRCILGIARLFGVENQTYKTLMIEGMERDKALIAMLNISGKLSKVATAALNAHTTGEEQRAISLLHLGKGTSNLAKFEVEELFVVAACIYSQRIEQRSSKLPSSQ